MKILQVHCSPIFSEIVMTIGLLIAAFAPISASDSSDDSLNNSLTSMSVQDSTSDDSMNDSLNDDVIPNIIGHGNNSYYGDDEIVLFDMSLDKKRDFERNENIPATIQEHKHTHSNDGKHHIAKHFLVKRMLHIAHALGEEDFDFGMPPIRAFECNLTAIRFLDKKGNLKKDYIDGNLDITLYRNDDFKANWDLARVRGREMQQAWGIDRLDVTTSIFANR